MDKTICIDCLNYEDLTPQIQMRGIDRTCNFCNTERKTLLFSEILEIVEEGIRFEWDNPENGMPRDGGEWLDSFNPVKDSYDLLSDEFALYESPIFDFLSNGLCDYQWCDTDLNLRTRFTHTII